MRKCIKIVRALGGLIGLLIISCFSISCQSSLVYSPALNIPSESLEQGDVNIGANFMMVPETRPFSVSPETSTTSYAAHSGLTCGLTDKLAIRAEGLIDVSEDNFFERGGLAFSLLYSLTENEGENIQWILIPKFGLSLDQKIIESGVQSSGAGFSLALAGRIRTSNPSLKPYFGMSTIYGFADWDHEEYFNDLLGDSRIRNGFAVGLHGGLNYEFNNWLNFNFELPLLYQYNHFEDIGNFIPTPTLGVNVDLSLRN